MYNLFQQEKIFLIGVFYLLRFLRTGARMSAEREHGLERMTRDREGGVSFVYRERINGNFYCSKMMNERKENHT